MRIEDYKDLIYKMLDSMDESDYKFIVQIYTIIKHHIKKK